MSRRSPSGSPKAWSDRRNEYRKASGPVSNPGDGRVRTVGRRSYLRTQRKVYLRDWDAALAEDAVRLEYQIEQLTEAQEIRAEMFPPEDV